MAIQLAKAGVLGAPPGTTASGLTGLMADDTAPPGIPGPEGRYIPALDYLARNAQPPGDGTGNAIGANPSGIVASGNAPAAMADAAVFSGMAKGGTGFAVDAALAAMGLTSPTGNQVASTGAKVALNMVAGLFGLGLPASIVNGIIGGALGANTAKTNAELAMVSQAPKIDQNLEFQAVPSPRVSGGEDDDTGLVSDPNAVTATVSSDPADAGPTSDDGGNMGIGLGEPGGVAWQHGGPVHGPKGIDNVPGRLTAGEFVVDKDSAQQFKGLLGLMNRWEPR